MADNNVKIQLELVDGPAQKALADFIKTSGSADKAVGGLNKSLGGLSKGADETSTSFSGFVKIITEDLGNKGSASVGQLSSLLNGPLLIALGGVAAAGLFAKKALDLTLLAERNSQIENSFDAIAKSAGLAGDALKEGLVAAARGLVDDTDLLQAANKSIIELGSNANKIPEIMEIARKSTALFGGDLVQNFETLSQSLANGNTKQLKNIGLVIDAEKAQREYAQSLGVSVEFLSEAGKKQAIQNEALEQAKVKFANVDESSTSATQSLKRLTAQFSGLGDSVAAAANQSGFFSTVFDFLADKVGSVANVLTGKFGNSVQFAGYELQKAKSDVAQYTQTLAFLQEKLEKQPGNQKAGLVAEIDKLTGKLELAKATVNTLSQVIDVIKTKPVTPEKGPDQIDRVALAKKQFETLDAQARASAEIQSTIAQGQADHEIAILKYKLTQQQITQAEFDEQSLALTQQGLDAKNAADEQRFLDENARLQANFDNNLIGISDYYAKRDKLAADFATRSAKDQAAYQKLEDTARQTAADRAIKDRTNTLNTFATLQNSNNQVLATIGKAAGLTQIAIATPPAVASAIAFGTATGGPPLGAVFAGITYAAMAAQAAQLAGLNFANGGIVPGTSYAGDNVAANVNSGEMILNRQQQASLFSQIKSGGVSSDTATTNALLSAIASSLQQGQSIQIDGREIVHVLRDQVASGRRFE